MIDDEAAQRVPQAAAEHDEGAPDEDDDPRIGRVGRDPGVVEKLEKRQRMIEDLWLRSVPTTAIARMLNIPRRTVRRELEGIKRQLQLERLPTLGERLDRAISTLRLVQTESWNVYTKLTDERSQNKILALRLVADVEHQIADLEGTKSPDAITTRTVADLQEVLVTTLAETGGAELVKAFLANLRNGARSNASGLLLPSLAPTITTIDAESTTPPQTQQEDR
jgi:hypothetical protein